MGVSGALVGGAATLAPGSTRSQRGPVLVQISTPPAAPPRAHAKACDTVGTSAPSNASHSASHTANGRRMGAKEDLACMGGAREKRVAWRQCLRCMPSFAAAGAPAGAVVDTFTFSGTRLSPPLASLTTRVRGTSASFSIGPFRSMSMT